MNFLTKKEFEKKYNEMLLTEFAKELNVSTQTIRNYALRLGLKREKEIRKIRFID